MKKVTLVLLFTTYLLSSCTTQRSCPQAYPKNNNKGLVLNRHQ